MLARISIAQRQSSGRSALLCTKSSPGVFALVTEGYGWGEFVPVVSCSPLFLCRSALSES